MERIPAIIGPGWPVQWCLEKVARHFVSSDWEKLQIGLKEAYASYQKDVEWRPSPGAQELLISGEDHRFFSHPGFDVIAICRAIYRRVCYGVVEGASTIHQQIVRVLTANYERALSRKIREILLATLVTTIVPKKDLPGLYLRIGYYGWRMNNYREACSRLGVNPASISLVEAARLVARLKYPEPQKHSANRSSQIERRARHLLSLHAVHASTMVQSRLKLEVKHATI
jgi:membrane peptidoglycan carboxypeptidase